MEQGTFDEILIEQARVRNEVLAKELDRLLKEVAAAVNSQRLAVVNGVSYQYVRAIQNTNGEQKPFPKDMVPSLMTEKPDCFMESVVSWFCEACGYDKPKKKRHLTFQEENERLKAAIKRHGLDKLPAFDGLL